MITEKDIIDLFAHFERVTSLAKAYLHKPISYGTDDIIYHSELLLIKAVRNNPDKNMSELADILFITKGAISQTANKLINRGYLRKFKYEDNKKEIFLSLTNKGDIVYDTAMNSYKEPIQRLINFFDKKENDIELIHNFLSELENIKDDLL